MDRVRPPRREPRYQSLAGREDVVQSVETMVEDLARGSGGCLIAVGSAGFGKSRLLDHAVHLATERAVRVARGAATPLDHLAPLTTLTTTLRSWAETREVLDDLGASSDAPVLIDRLGSCLARLASLGPLLVVIDDVHRADEFTALALRMLVPALADSPVLWLLTTAPDRERLPVRDALEYLLDRYARRLELSALTEVGVVELCTQLTGSAPRPGLLALLAQAGGHPLLIAELVRALDDEGRLCRVAGCVELVPGDELARADGRKLTTDEVETLPEEFVEAVGRRIRGLSREARAVLDAAAVLGRPCTLREVAGVADRPIRDLAQGVVELVRAKAVIEIDHGLTFRHGLTAAAVYRLLSVSVRRTLHLDAARVVEAEGTSVAEVATHLVRGREGDSVRVAAVLRAVVSDLHVQSPSATGELATALVELLDALDEATVEAVVTAMRHLLVAGLPDRARSLGEQALRRVAADESGGALLLAMTEPLDEAGGVEAVVEHTRQALEQACISEQIRADLFGEHAFALARSRELLDATAPARSAVELGTRHGRPAAVVLGFVAGSVAARAAGDLTHAHDLARDAARTANEAGLPVDARDPRFWLAAALVSLDRFAEADAVLTMIERDVDGSASTSARLLLRLHRAEHHLAAGRVGAAAEQTREGLALAEESHDVVEIPLLALMSEIEMRNGRVQEARRLLDRALGRGTLIGNHHRAQLLWCGALVAEIEGRDREARRAAAAFAAAVHDVNFLLVGCPEAAGSLVRFALRRGAPDQARRTARAVAAVADRNPTVTSLAAAAAHTTALVADDLDGLYCAVELFRHSPRPLPRAAAIEDAGEAEIGRGAIVAGRALIEEAEAIWARSGAAGDAGRVRQRLADLDASATDCAAADGRAAPTVDAGLLTPSETRVVRLVADGLTNREVASRLVLSPHTVDSHLRNSFAKLEVTSRVELTRRFLQMERKG